MATDFLHELRWRGLLHEATPGVEDLLAAGPVKGYIGFDPTADSLHVGNLVPIMMLVHFQSCGHIPVALVGGATGMVGDPSGKRSERQLLDEATLRHNTERIRAQLARFMDLGDDRGRMVNNYDWLKGIGFLEFIRDVGKHITVNYMMAKDSVRNRLETGISFTEFSYQLVQGYDFVHLHRTEGVRLQMGGSDQWGNITTGTELIRRMDGGEAHAITSMLLTRADGSKFGKSEGGNVWLDPARTSPYRFYQFWLNTSDADAERYVRIFTTWTREQVDACVEEHLRAPHLRHLQKSLAGDITLRLHGRSELDAVLQATDLIFGQAGAGALAGLTEQQWADVFDGVPRADVPRDLFTAGIAMVDLLSERTGFLPSKGEARRALREGSIAVNKTKAAEDRTIDDGDLIGGRYLLLQRGRKNYFLVKAI